VAPDAGDLMMFTRLNRHYAPALRLATLVLRNTALLDRAGTADASAFLVDMNDLFQRFLTDRLRRALRGRLTVDDEPTRWLD
jgi:5-methylcytosine-specific restriction enzyme subunit McrC